VLFQKPGDFSGAGAALSYLRPIFGADVVLSRDGERLVGIVSIGDLATQGDSDAAEAALSGVSEPGGEHNQSQDG